jgi:hypothetical protein
MNMLDSYRDTLKEFGIIGANIPENNSKENLILKNKLAQTISKDDSGKADDLNNSFMNLDQKLFQTFKKSENPFNDEFDLLISTLESQYDFLIPFDQITMLGDTLFGKWFTGLFVCLSPRPIDNRY